MRLTNRGRYSRYRMIMRSKSLRVFLRVVLVFGLTASLPFILSEKLSTYAQGIGNSIDGYVIGIDRQPIADLNIELLDSLGRTSGHARTDTRGYYSFRGMGRGRFIVHVYTWGTD